MIYYKENNNDTNNIKNNLENKTTKDNKDNYDIKNYNDKINIKSNDSDDNKKFNLRDFSKMELADILEYYNSKENNSADNLSDILYYIYHYEKSNKTRGKYSENFIQKYKDSKNLRNTKKLFKKRIKNYSIGINKELLKLVGIKDINTNDIIYKNLKVIPKKERENCLEYFHKITCHKNYHILYYKIIEEGYIWNNLNKDCIDYINNCYICKMKNRANFIPPPTNQILCNYPKELYVMDLTSLPSPLINNEDDDKYYLLSIIDHFSKFAKNYIINNKSGETILKKFKAFIENYGTPDKILTDNGKEFSNKIFLKFCKKKDIEILHGRPRHPQTQGVVERYNRTIKDLLKNSYYESEKNNIPFNLKTQLKEVLEQYNKTKHSSTGYAPEILFNCKDEYVFEIVKKNIIKSQIYIQKNRISSIKDKKGLLAERFNLIGNKIKLPLFGGKGRYIIPVNIIKNISNCEYLITLGISYGKLDKNKNYYCDYHLLKLSDNNTYNELVIKNQNK